MAPWSPHAGTASAASSISGSRERICSIRSTDTPLTRVIWLATDAKRTTGPSNCVA